MINLGPDNDAQLDFPVHLGCPFGDSDRIIRPTEARRSLGKQHRFSRPRHAGFISMARIVKPHTVKVRCITDSSTKPAPRGKFGQVFCIKVLQFCDHLKRNRGHAEVIDHTGKITDAAIGGKHGRFFSAFFTISDEFHERPSTELFST